MRKLHYFKIIYLILLGGLSFYLMSEETKGESSLEGEALEVRDQFPRYRVLYNHQQVIQEVRDQLQSKDSKKQPEKNK